MKNYKLEIACFNLESALIAQQGGADRIELCDNMKEGGTTPAFATVELARKNLSIDLFIMIRPRGGNFIYSDSEFEQMKFDIERLKKVGVNGFVFGILNDAGSVDIKRNTALVALANPLPCSFHRAFDVVDNVFKSLEDVIDCGFKTILTSGQQPTAIEGIDTLIELVKQANNKIIIMPGGGVRSSTIVLLKEKTQTSFYHSSAITDKSDLANIDEVKLLKAKLK